MLAIGMIGAGFMAQVAHLPAFGQVASCRVTALADDRRDLLETVGNRFGIVERHEDFHALLASRSVDAVMVTMPRRCQSVIVRAVIEHRIPVLSEKPLALTAAVAEDLAAAARANGTLAAALYQRRFDAGVRLFAERFHSLLESGELGTLMHLRMNNFCAAYSVPIPEHVRSSGPRLHRYPEDPDLPAGLPAELRRDYEYTANVAIHDLNLLHMLFGGRGLTPLSFHVRRGGCQTMVVGVPGADACLSVGPADIGTWDQRLDAYFKNGCLSLVQDSTLAPQPRTLVIERSAKGEECFRPPVAQRFSPFHGQASAFVDAVRGVPVAIATVEDAVRDLRLIEGLWRMAAVTG
nr:Gfo/Idh/MocA family oxidoreductase [Azospirillum sp. 412522]